jgi:hypothetical protein
MNDRMIDELTGIEVVSWKLPGGTEKNHIKPQSGQLVYLMSTSQILVQV